MDVNFKNDSFVITSIKTTDSRLSECALMLLFHLDDISNYLDKFVNIVNGISILDRTFVEMEILKPTYVAIALLGIHILKPYQFLLMDSDTSYSTS